jgi:hypothetical protein
MRWSGAALALIATLATVAWHAAKSAPARGQRLDGFNIIVAPGHPFGSASARVALAGAKGLGARAIAIVPFLWQADPASPELVRGKDMDDAELRTAIQAAHALGLAVLVKPHVWIPKSWAGAVAMTSEANWQEWFANYRHELERIAKISESEKAEALAIGTELTQTSQRPEWKEVIAVARSAYTGRLLYVAHNAEEAEAVPFWDELDAIGASLYPPLGADDDGSTRRSTMHAVADRLDILAARNAKPVIVGEIGLRSAQGAAAKPWESAEERTTAPDPGLQADVLTDWLAALDRPAIQGILIWRWLTDPDAGGPSDTDFTVQGKPAEHVLMCAWTHDCDQATTRYN